MAVIRLEEQNVFDFCKHFLFGLPQRYLGPSDLLVMTQKGPTPDDDSTVIVKNKDIFKARRRLLQISGEIDTLKRHGMGWIGFTVSRGGAISERLAEQFRVWTGLEPDMELIREVLHG